jgi:hypothetical protein
MVLVSSVFAFVLVALGGFALLFGVPDFVDRLDAGSPEAWLLLCVVGIVPGIVVASAVLFIRYYVVQPVLRTARRIGPAQPDRFGSILTEMIKRYIERKSARVLIIWSAVLLLFSTYSTIVYALVISAPSVLMLFGTIVCWLVALWYAVLLVFKLRAQRSARRY